VDAPVGAPGDASQRTQIRAGVVARAEDRRWVRCASGGAFAPRWRGSMPRPRELRSCRGDVDEPRTRWSRRRRGVAAAGGVAEASAVGEVRESVERARGRLSIRNGGMATRCTQAGSGRGAGRGLRRTDATPVSGWWRSRTAPAQRCGDRAGPHSLQADADGETGARAAGNGGGADRRSRRADAEAGQRVGRSRSRRSVSRAAAERVRTELAAGSTPCPSRVAGADPGADEAAGRRAPVEAASESWQGWLWSRSAGR
jgi:hypothetical protein